MAMDQTTLKLGPADRGRAVSSEEFAGADFEAPWRYERVDGRLIVMAPPGEEHSNVAVPLRDRLGAYRLGHPKLVDRVMTEAWVRVDEGTDRIGDIGVFLAGERSQTRRPDRVPELMFEVVSLDRESQDRDYIEKRREYHRLGVLKYVIIDRFARKVTVLTHAPEGYRERALGPGEPYASPLLPGFEVAPGEFF